MKKMILAVAIILALAFFTAGWQVLAQDNSAPPSENTMPMQNHDPMPMPDDDPMPMPGYRMQEMMKELGITEEQLAAMQEARSEHMKEIIEINAKLKVAQIELRELMLGHDNDDAVIAKHNEIKNINAQISEMRLRHHLAQRAIFTAEQWEKVSKTFGKMHRRYRSEQSAMRQRGFYRRQMHGQRPDGFRGRMQPRIR